MLKNKKIRAAALVGAAVSIAAGAVWTGAAGAAIAGPTKATAPYAQAAAVINADGSIDRAKGIKAVTNPATGQFCVELEDKDLDIAKLVPMVNVKWASDFNHQAQAYTLPAAACGNRKDTALVLTGIPGKWINLGFSIVIP